MLLLLSHLQGDAGHGRYLRALGIAAVVAAEHWFIDLDRALEWTEDQLLGRDRFQDGSELAPRDMAWRAQKPSATFLGENVAWEKSTVN
jgi:hypothetical protein